MNTPSQDKVLAYVRARLAANERGFIYWMGGVRSGKSYGSCMALVEHLAQRKNKVYMVLAYTAKQGLTVFGNALMEIAEAAGIKGKLNRGMTNPHIHFENGCEVLFRGADKEGRDKAIQGLTLSGLVVDEVPNLHRATIHQAEARVSDLGALRIYTSNKTSPYHWSTKYYHDRMVRGEIEGLLIDSHVQDNMNVDASYREERANEFTGNTLRRFMDNEFTLDNPAIYQPNQFKKRIKKGEPDWTVVYGHSSGYEVLCARWIGGQLVVYQANSIGAYERIAPVLKAEGTFLLNSTQALLARQLRGMGKSVRGFCDHFEPFYMEIIKEACRRKILWISKQSSSLWEAVETYCTEGCYDYPIVKAFEALAFPLQNHVS